MNGKLEYFLNVKHYFKNKETLYNRPIPQKNFFNEN